MYFLINRTVRLRIKEADQTVRPMPNSKWPLVETLGDFVSPGDVLELIEVAKEDNFYYGVNYIHEQVYTFGMHRVNADKTGYMTAKENAEQWLAARLEGRVKPLLPRPRCECGARADTPADLQSLADTGKCYGCRVQRRDVVVPRPKKRKKKRAR